MRYGRSPDFTLDELKSLVSYDKETGDFTRLKSKDGRHIGRVPKIYITNGYLTVSVKGRMYLAHRLALFYMTGEWPSDCVDHINGIKDDNRLENLRHATRLDNSRNQKICATNKTGFKGVHFVPRINKWRADIRVNKATKYLGYFTSPELAHELYCLAADMLYGQFANYGEKR